MLYLLTPREIVYQAHAFRYNGNCLKDPIVE